MHRKLSHTVDLTKINSMTKYPSIPTYHVLDPKDGKLTEARNAEMVSELRATEKIDGTNSRIIQFPDDSYIIGSREELLYADGDLIGNPALGIVDAMKYVLKEGPLGDSNYLTVFYFETYGGKVTAQSKQYTGEKRVGVRLFDVAIILDWVEMLKWPATAYSTWRESDTERFVDEAGLARYGFTLSLVPRWSITEPLPLGVADTYEWLKGQIQQTACGLDEGAGGRPEGLVVRTLDRSKIVKIRFEDYERTLKRKR